MNQETVISKIKKLLALANGAGTEAEAAAAANKAQELLMMFNLEMAQVDATPDFNGRSRADETKRVKETYTRSALFAYQRALWKQVAEANYCWYEAMPIYKTNSLGVHMKVNYHHYLIGREANVISAKLLGDYLEETMSRICPYSSGKAVTSWKEGCAARLVERLQQKKFDMEQESRPEAPAPPAGCTALTLRDVNQHEYDENYRFVNGEEAYKRYVAWRHSSACMCEICVERRSWRSQVVEAPEPLTEAQKRAEAKRDEQRRRRWQREDERDERRRAREWARKDQAAYVAGVSAADDIGLDPQVAERRQRAVEGK